MSPLYFTKRFSLQNGSDQKHANIFSQTMSKTPFCEIYQSYFQLTYYSNSPIRFRIMALKKQAPKWILFALLMGTVSGFFCLMVGITGPMANAIPFGIAAGMMYATRDKWQA